MKQKKAARREPRQGTLSDTTPQSLIDEQAALMGASPLGDAHNQALLDPFRGQLQAMQSQINEFPDLSQRLAQGEDMEAIHKEALRRISQNSVPIGTPVPAPPQGPQ